VAVDEALTKRFYKAIGKRNVTEKKMMGGLCFMLAGNMIGGADRHAKTDYGRFMFRVGKDNEEIALSYPGTTSVVQGKRKMTGMVFVDADNCTDNDLKALAKLALAFAKTLPEK